MSNCCLEYTDWLSDIILPTDRIGFSPPLQTFMRPFDPLFSGIWRPLITNNIKWATSEYLIPYNINPSDTGILDYSQRLLGHSPFITISSPGFKSWIINPGSNLRTQVDIGMTFDNAKYYLYKNNRDTTQPSIQAKKIFSTQTINVIRNKLNDEVITDEFKLSLKGTVPRIDSKSSIDRIEVIPRAKTFGLELNNSALLNLFSVELKNNNLEWKFVGDATGFKYLSTNEYLILDYTVFTSKNQPDNTIKTGQYSIRVLIFGKNDPKPPSVIEDTGSTSIDLSLETTPYTTGFITLEDLDLSQDVYYYVEDVSISGPQDNLRSSIDDIKKMFSVSRNTLRNSLGKKQTVQWFFNSGGEKFEYLKDGETLNLTYNIYVYDNLGQYITYTKTIAIVGKNEAPGIGIYNIGDSSGGIYDLNNPLPVQGKLTISDIDYGDSITSASVIGVGLEYSIVGAVSDPYSAFKGMLNITNVSANSLEWEFIPNNNFLKYLSGYGIVKINFSIQIMDSKKAAGYAVVSIVVIGKNESVSSSLSNIDVTIPLVPISNKLIPTNSIKFETQFNIYDLNNSDTVNVAILYCEYNHTETINGIPQPATYDIPKNLDIKHMLYFIPIKEKRLGQSGAYRLIFDSSPESFRYLDSSNKKIILFYKVIITDSSGSYQINDIKFTITGVDDPIIDYNTKNSNLKFADYIWGWYRYYDMGRPGDKRFIPGVDFYFGDVDTFLFYGEPEFLIPQPDRVSLPSGYVYEYATSGLNIGSKKLVIKNNTNDLIISKNLDKFFPNGYEKSGVLAILKTHPYIDFITHDLTDIDAFGYTRDEYGRILPYLSGLSIKEFNSFGNRKFPTTLHDIVYRLADKYGLRMIAQANVPIQMISKFKSCTGPNIGIQQTNKIFHKRGSTNFSFMDVGVTVGALKYDKQLCKSEDMTANIIELNTNRMRETPIIDYGPCGDDDSVLDLSPTGDYSRYNENTYFFNMIDYRLNNELFHQEYIINNITGNYSNIDQHKSKYNISSSGMSNNINSNINLDLHGHGGIKDKEMTIVYASGDSSGIINGNVFFDPIYPVTNIENIEGLFPDSIILNYFANRDSEGEIGNINIEYLRSTKKPKCRSFINKNINNILSTVPNSFRYDFRNNYYISRAYVPSVSTYYIPQTGFYYANHLPEHQKQIGIHLENHPYPLTPLTRTHNLAVINPLDTWEPLYNDLFTLSYNGTFDFSYNLNHLPAGRVFLYALAASGSFTLSLLPLTSASDTVTIPSGSGGIDNTVYLEFNPQFHNKALIEVSVPEDCDNWTVRLSHEKFDYIKLPLISKLNVDAKMGFFHPNKGWLDLSTHPQYLWKTPMAPYAPPPLEVKQTILEKNNKIRPEHYFWYDAEKMYTDQYLNGTNLIIDTSGMIKPFIDIIDKAEYVGFPQDGGNFYWVTPDFYKFRYIEEESPIKKSIKMSYLHMDSSYWYPFNDFIYSLVDPIRKNKIAVYSMSDNQRCFAYFDDKKYANHYYVTLTNSDTINVNNQIITINQTISNITELIKITQIQIQDFSARINIINSDPTVSSQDKITSIQKINLIIKQLQEHIGALNNNISALNTRRTILLAQSNNPFSSAVISSSGNNESLILTLAQPLPPYLLNGGFIKRNINQDKHESLLLYRSNITRNDPDIKVGKWGNIIAGEDVSEYNNSILRQKKWTQSAVFFNFFNGTIANSGYYFPYSYTSNEYDITGNKIYNVIPNEYNEKYNFEDYGLISAISGGLHSYIYAGPYTGPIQVSRVPRRQLVQINSFNDYLYCQPAPSGISNYQTHNLRGNDFIRIQKTSPKQLYMNCAVLNQPYAVMSKGLTKFKTLIATNPEFPVKCNNDVDPFTNENIFILNTIATKFNPTPNCLGTSLVKFNNAIITPENFYKPKIPIYFELSYLYNNIYPYLSKVLPYHSINSKNSTYGHTTFHDKFLGNLDGWFFTYVNDPLAQDREGLITSNRYTIYNHNDAYNIKNYSNIVGDDSPNPKIQNPVSPVSITSLLPEQITNNDLLDSVISSIDLQIYNINNTIMIIQQNAADSAISIIDKNKYIQNIKTLSDQLIVLNQTKQQLSDNKVSTPIPQYINLDKIQRHTNINFSENKYKAKNPFIDMNIFSFYSDPRFHPTYINNQPAMSGYAYFEGLVEPPEHKFYDTMNTKYNPYKIWIDIPKNAKWGIMHKDGKVFWQNTIYSVQTSFKVNCDDNAKKCDKQKPEGAKLCDSQPVLFGAAELYSILKFNSDLFETIDISLPENCGNINLCCDSFYNLESSNLSKDGYEFDSINDCILAQTNQISGCIASYYPSNKISYIDMFCYDMDCPAPSGFGGFPIGSLSGTNYGYDVSLGANETPIMSGRANVVGESLLMFRLKPPAVASFINPNPLPNNMTFIDTNEKLYSPDVRIDNTIFNHQHNEGNSVIPFSGVGYIVLESGDKNPQWLQKNCSYRSLVEKFDFFNGNVSYPYLFKEINSPQSKFIDLKFNHNNFQWKNEQLYRDHVPHSGCFYGFMGEYDIQSNLNNNPFYQATLYVNGRPPLPFGLPLIKNAAQSGLCDGLKDLKSDCFEPGPLYTTIIQDGSYSYVISIELKKTEDRFVTNYMLELGDKTHSIDIEHTPNSWDYFLYGSTTCENYEVQFDKDVLLQPQCYQDKKTLFFEPETLKAPFHCKTNKCPEEWFYCDDENINFKRIYGTVEEIPLKKDPNCADANAAYGDVSVTKVDTVSFKLGRSLASCQAYIALNPANNFSHSPHPNNYHYVNVDNYTTFLCFPEPEYKSCLKYFPNPYYAYIDPTNYLAFKINVYHNLLEIILPNISAYSWPDSAKNRNRFYIPRDSSFSLFPIIKTYVKNKNIKVDGWYNITNNFQKYLGEVEFKNV